MTLKEAWLAKVALETKTNADSLVWHEEGLLIPALSTIEDLMGKDRYQAIPSNRTGLEWEIGSGFRLGSTGIKDQIRQALMKGVSCLYLEVSKEAHLETDLTDVDWSLLTALVTRSDLSEPDNLLDYFGQSEVDEKRCYVEYALWREHKVFNPIIQITATEAVDEIVEALHRIVDISGAESATVMIRPSTSYLISLAKIRALRAVLRLLAELGTTPKVSITAIEHQMAETHIDLIRMTCRAMGMVAGGCDRLILGCMRSSSDQLLNEQIAIHQIMIHEAYQAIAIDPAAGSYYIESLTDQIASKAWDKFRKEL